MPPTWFAVLAFAASFGFYLLLAGALTWTETAAAIATACATSGFVTIQRIRQWRPIALAMPPGRVLIRTLISLATDTAQMSVVLLAAIGGARRGAAEWQAFHPGSSSPRDAGRRALVTLLTSLAPNGFVLDLRPSALPEADHGLLLHRLAPAQPLSDPDWPA